MHLRKIKKIPAEIITGIFLYFLSGIYICILSYEFLPHKVINLLPIRKKTFKFIEIIKKLEAGTRISIQRNYIKVLLIKKEKIVIKNISKIINEASKGEILTKNKSFTFIAKNDKIKIEGIGVYTGPLILNGKNIELNRHKYSGEIIIYNIKGQLFVINKLNVEEYLKGVLPCEISPTWHIEAIKAQAVATRSFAYYEISHSNGIYDVKANVLSQVYKGSDREKRIFNRAIKETEDEVLVYKGELVPAYFHACCGGHTADSDEVWNKKLPALRGVPCGYCYDSPYYRWNVVISKKEILKKFNLRKVYSIRPVRITRSGRWKKIRIRGEPDDVVITGNKFRLILGADKIKSTKIRIYRVRGGFKIYGYGWGHGVGMCQWGAKKMAEKGYSYRQILAYYYRGARIKKISALK